MGVVVADVVTPRYHSVYNGNSRVNGTIRLESDLASGRAVYLFDSAMRIVALTLSADDGTFEFPYLRSGVYLIVGRDPVTDYMPDITRVVAEPMQ